MAGAGTNLATYFVNIVPTTKGIKNNLAKQVGAPVDAVGKKAGSSLGQKMGTWAKRSLKAAAVGGVAAVGVAVGAAVMTGFKSAVSRQNSEKVLSGLYGSAVGAKQVMDDLRKVSDQSPLNYTSYLKAAESLAYAGVTGKTAVGTLENVGLAIVAAGGDSEKLDQAMGGVLKAVNNGGIAMMDSLSMISDSGVPILSGLADKFGEPINVIKDMASKGQISIEDVMSVLEQGQGDTFKQMMKAGDAASQSFGNQWAAAKDRIVNAVADNLLPLLDAIAPAIKPAADALVKVIEFFPDMVGWVKQAWAVLKYLSPLIMGIVAAFAAWSAVWAIQKGIAIAALIIEKQWLTLTGLRVGWLYASAAAQRVFNAAMAANPIGLVIAGLVLLVSALVFAYKRFGWFRDMVDGVWAWLKNAAAGFVEGWSLLFTKAIPAVLSDLGKFFKGTFDFIVLAAKLWWTGVKAYFMFLWELIKGVGRVFVWLYENAVKPAFDFIVAAAKLWWQGVKLYFKAVWTGVQYVGKFFVWLYEKAVKPAFDFIVAAAKLWWAGVKAYFTAIINGAKAVGRGFVWLYEKIKAAFNFIVNAAKQWWARTKATFWAAINFIRTVFWGAWSWIRDKIAAVWSAITGRIRNAWSAIKATFWTIINYLRGTFANAWNWLRDKIKNIWGSIRSNIANVWSAIKDRTFNPMMNFIKNTIPNAFRAGVDAIKRAWDRLKSVARKPVEFVVNTVIQKGIIDNFNKIAKTFKVKEIGDVSLPRGFDRGGWTGPGSRLTPAGIVHADEYVIKKSSRRRFEDSHPGLLDHINRTGTLPGVDGYAKGGRVGTSGMVWNNLWGIIKRQFPWARLTSAYRPGSITASGNRSYHAQGKAVDLAGRGSMNAADMMKIFNFIEKNYGQSSEVIYSPAGGRQIKNGRRYFYRGAVRRMHFNHVHWANRSAFGGPTAGAAGGVHGAGGGGFNPLDMLNNFLEPFRNLKKRVSDIPGVGAMLDLAKGGAKTAIQWPIDFIKKNISKVGDIAVDIADAANAGTAKAQVKAVAAKYGWHTGREWDAIKWLVQKESSWNPRAANPTSSARGLFQKMTCLVTDAEILTREGWKRHDEVQPGDETIGYNPETGRNEWTRVKRVVHYDNAPIVHMRNGRVAYRSTPNHRWLTEQRYALGTERMVETQDLNVSHRLVVAAPAAIPAELDITTAEAALIGWLLSDGTLRMPGLPDGLDGREPVGHLYQSKPDMIPVIEALLDETVGDYGHTEREPRGKATLPAHTWRLRSADVRSLVERARLVDGLERFVTRLSMEQRAAFLTAVKQAEGTPVTYGETELWRIPQLDGPKQDAFIMAAYLDGYKPLVNAVDTSRSEFNARPLSQVTLASPTVGVQSLTFETDPELYDVWCVETELGTWTARDLGQVFLTGNSIHGPVEKTAAGQAGWGLKYIKNRYGSPTAAQNFWRRNNWYADGGLVKPHVFDGGGWLTDRMVAIHQKRKPDAVLSESQWRDMHTIAQNTAQRQGEGTTINITVNGVDTDNAQAVAQELRFEMARIGRGGKYALGNA